MRAKVKYNDFRGTAAADMSDHTNINKYLKEKGVDTDKYLAVGTRINFTSLSEVNEIAFSIICIDKNTKSLKEICFESNQLFDQLRLLFKQFQIVILNDHFQHLELDNNPLYIDDRVE